MKVKNKDGFSIIIAVFLMLITTLLAIYLLEYIIPFGKNVKGMENGTKAYYEANKGIEDVLFSMKDKDAYFENSKIMPTTSTGFSYNLIATGTTIPIIGNGNSEFDSNYNKISSSNPVQLLLKGSINWSNVEFYFKVPHFDDTTGSAISFSGGNSPIINWQLSSDTSTLNATGSYVVYNDVDNSTGSLTSISFNNKYGFTLSGTIETFNYFYNDTNNNCTSSGCILKLSVVNELKTNDGKKIPYLEYKITGFSTPVANYYTKISASGKSTGYKKSLELDVPQQTTIEAFDFTVFQ